MKTEEFVKLMTGHFDNKEQFTEMKATGKYFRMHSMWSR